MSREACDLALENGDEAVKLENKGLIAQLVWLPLNTPWEFGCGAGESGSVLFAWRTGGSGCRLVCVPGQGPPCDDGRFHAAASRYSPGAQEAVSRTEQRGPLYLIKVAAMGLFILTSVVRKTAFGRFTSYMNVNKIF